MSSASAPVECLLTDQGGGYYAGLPGTLTLSIQDKKGTTQFNTAKSVVWDVTNYPTQTAVSRTCTATDLTFTIEKGHSYHVQLECIQLPSPYDALAQLLEQPCGAALIQIDVVNQMPGLMVQA